MTTSDQHVLVTGSSGWLGQTLVRRLRDLGHRVVGLDQCPGPQTDLVASVTDRDAIRRALDANQVEAVVHAAALHKPDIARRPASDFVSVNVQGTLNLLEAAVAGRIPHHLFTLALLDLGDCAA